MITVPGMLAHSDGESLGMGGLLTNHAAMDATTYRVEIYDPVRPSIQNIRYLPSQTRLRGWLFESLY